MFYNSYCVDEIMIEMWNGYDSWNEPLSGTIVTVKGYVEYKTRLIRNLKGEEVVSSCMIYLPKKIERAAYLGRRLMHEDRIWLAGEDSWRAIIDIRQPKDFSSAHYEVYLA